MSFQIQPAGETAVVLSLSYDKTRESVAAVHALLQKVRQSVHPSVRSLQPALDSLLIEYEPDPSFDSWLETLREAEPLPLVALTAKETIEIPVCYEFGKDLQNLEAQTGLTTTQIIELHSGKNYEVWMMGFMPGFPYLGELPSKLQVERKRTPELAIAAGSVAIGEEYVGIYPFESPGGWHVIGRTPVQIVDYNRRIPWILDYGMTVRFQPISAEEYESLI
jgi:inhibitor of KinA